MNKSYKKMYGYNIMYYRTRANYSQTTLADLCGVNQYNISLWESGKALPSILSRKALTEVFHVDLTIPAKSNPFNEE